MSESDQLQITNARAIKSYVLLFMSAAAIETLSVLDTTVDLFRNKVPRFI